MRKEGLIVLYTLLPIFGTGFLVLYLLALLAFLPPLELLVSWDLGMMIIIWLKLKKVFGIREMLLNVEGAYRCSALDLCRLLFTLADRYDGAAVKREEIRNCADVLFPRKIVLKAIQMEEEGKG